MCGECYLHDVDSGTGDALFKPLISQMEYYSGNNFTVRMSAIQSVAGGIGSSYELHFPETAPYLAELLKDDSEEMDDQISGRNWTADKFGIFKIFYWRYLIRSNLVIQLNGAR
ncbi:hypothetical protein HELRODRAFT_178759 [Helobdella robusta]|uniref:Uncharacterized protein n=1 Tax=Helobdella robusta TaxID=6412 RepID=T1FDP3_HELRO|nr:hypothetical protein HELRODRAFT_178759 [Helobdella robusta]ESN96957.1 hypothetical protein HELRODRAFT_178759 [Helobdella robusta]